MRTARQSAWRFALVGAFNTLTGYGLFLLFVMWWPPAIAYAVCYAIGIAIAVAVNIRWSFGGSLSTSTIILTLAVYLVTLALVTGFVAYGDHVGVPTYLLGGAAIVLSIVLNFLGTRFVVSRAEGPQEGRK